MKAKKPENNAVINNLDPKLQELLQRFELDNYETRFQSKGNTEALYIRLKRLHTPQMLSVK